MRNYLLTLAVLSVAGCAALDRMGGSPSGDEGAQIGVVGTVLGSQAGTVEVNGFSIDTPPETALTIGPNPVGQLENARIPVGTVVEIAAERQAGRLVAREVDAIFALQGPVQRVDPGLGRLTVMNTEVVLEPGAVVPPGGLASIRPGQRVAVSGIWRDEALIASRIDYRTQKSTQPVTAAGVVSPTPGGRYRIGGVPVAAEPGALEPGLFHVIEGEWVVDTLYAQDIRLGRTVVGRLPLERVAVEGFARERDYAGYHSGYPGPEGEGYFVGYSYAGEEGLFGDDPSWRDHWTEVQGLGGRVTNARALSELQGTRAIFVGRVGTEEDGGFRMGHAIPVPEGLAARRDTLSAVGDPLSPETGAID